MPTEPPPFGLGRILPAFDRATRLAKTLFQAAGSTIILVENGRVWRSVDPGRRGPQRSAIADHVMRTGEALWLEDASKDPRFDPASLPAGARMGLCAAAPVRIADGSIPGIVTVYDLQPRAFDPILADRLGDLAESVADECNRAGAMVRLERSEQRLQLALELAEISVTDIDYERETLETAGVVDMLGVSTYASLSKDPFAGVDPRDRDEVALAWKRHKREGVPYRPEYRVGRDGRQIWATSLTRVFKDDSGRIVRLVGASQNITRRKQAELALTTAKEEAEVANSAKSAFLATMSHEIRTPLNGVLGMAQAMAADALSPVQRERLEIIQRSGQTLLAILNDILDLSKIEAGKLDLELAEFNLAELVEGVHAVFAPAAAAKGCNLHLAFDADAEGTYRGDPTRVRQVLYNLVSNAVKFTEAGDVRMAVGACRDGVAFCVRDTGIGIAPDHMAALFRKFEQADASTTRRFGGTGLGLAICHELTTLMGGAIRVESRLGEGAAFTVDLPLVRVGDATAAPKPGHADQVPLATYGALRVLAAEDNEVNQLVLAALLQTIGAELRFADNGVEAVAAWEAEAWDVILMDIHMPGMDGPTATRIIRDRERELSRPRTPIIALTANAMAHQVQDYADAGMDDFVAKPIEITRLLAALRAAVEPTGTPGIDAARSAQS